MPDEYDIGAMDRAQQTAGGRVEGGVNSSSFWGDFASNLYSRRGELLDAAGTYSQGVGYGTYFSSLANRFGLEAGSAGLLADWAEIGMVFPELQQRVINIQTAIQRKQSMDKWLGRVSATKTRYARAGIAVDDRADTPMKAMLTLLESGQEELRWIEADKKVREFNEVFMPQIEAKVKKSSARYQQDILKINQDLAVKSGEIQAKAATTKAWAQVVSTTAMAFGGAGQ